eukprot:4600545-Pleurochrysis_carterae.AAC.4
MARTTWTCHLHNLNASAAAKVDVLRTEMVQVQVPWSATALQTAEQKSLDADYEDVPPASLAGVGGARAAPLERHRARAPPVITQANRF